jgi:opacity protein-like surface antigen
LQPLLPLCLLATAPASQPAAAAPGLSYSYVELGFALIRPDEDRADLGSGVVAEFDDAQAINVAASFSLSETFFVQGGLGVSDQDILLTDGVDVARGQRDERALTLGLGARHPLGNAVDVYAVAGIASVSVDVDFPELDSASDSETGLALELGVRALVASQLEFQASFARIDVYEATNVFGGTARFHVSDTISLALSAQASEDASALGLGVRFGF